QSRLVARPIADTIAGAVPVSARIVHRARSSFHPTRAIATHSPTCRYSVGTATETRTDVSAIKFITPEALKAWLKAPSEFALLDVREEGEFSEAHLLLASCLPLSHLELQLERLVPRRSVRLALIDADGAQDGLACRA